MDLVIVGIDVSKVKFDACFLLGSKSKHRVFDNSDSGFVAFKSWLEHNGAEHVHACMEATGTLWEALAQFLYDAGNTVSVVNPACIKAFANSELRRTKTDKVDASVIAHFCRALQPDPWTPPPPEVRKLQSLTRRLDNLKSTRQQEINRLKLGANCTEVVDSIKRLVECLDAEIACLEGCIKQHIRQDPDLKRKEILLSSIPGIGWLTAAVLLAEFGAISRFRNAREMAAYAGLVPREESSGMSIRGRTRLSKRGNARLRKALYMPAITASSCNPLLKSLYDRLIDRGKSKMSALGAVMRKLIHLAFGVIKNSTPFDPSFQTHPC